MRRITVLAVLLLTLALTVGLMAATDTPVKVFVNGAQKSLSPAAFMRNNTVYLPLKATVSAACATVKQEKNKSYTVTSDSKKTSIRESEGIKKNGQFFVPLSVMSKALSGRVAWDKGAKTVRISMGTEKARPQPKPSGG